MAEALENLAETGAFSEIEDPVQWQRELRADRPLWGLNAEQVPEILERLSTYLHEIRTLGRPERIEVDLRDQRFLLHTLLIAIQAAMDAASHLVTRELLGEPEASQDLLLLLGQRGWLSAELTASLVELVQLRYRIVYEYSSLDLGEIHRVIEEDLNDLETFIREIQSGLE